MTSNWYKKAAKLDDEGTDGSIFYPDGDYAPDKADFTEIPFEWLRPIKNGRLTNSFNSLLSNLEKMHPHISKARIAHSINIGATNYLMDQCDKYPNHNMMINDLGYDCAGILSKSPVKNHYDYRDADEIGSDYFANESDKISEIVTRKMQQYLSNSRRKRGN